MRAYSSLLGHIIGSHPEVCGYYEMHIGYHSWKSLIRQKALFFQEEKAKPAMRFMFDKVLHDDHFVAPKLLNHPRVLAIFSLRHPADAIPSIVQLYQKEDPGHAFTQLEYATNYYVNRANSLRECAAGIQKDYFYMDAEAITLNTDDCLAELTKWLNLRTPLDSKYQVQRKTAQGKYGDTSQRLKSGGIDKTGISPKMPMDVRLLEKAVSVYDKNREILARGAAEQCLHTHEDRFA